MQKQKKWLLIFAIAFAVLLIGYFVVVRPITQNGTGTPPATTVPTDDGEGSYLSMLTLFSRVPRADILYIKVHNRTSNTAANEYTFLHYVDTSSDLFYIMLEDDELYAPILYYLYDGYDYTQLYDQTKLSSLIVSTGTPYIKEKIIAENVDEATLERYGLAASQNPSWYEMKVARYKKDADGKEILDADGKRIFDKYETLKVYIGDLSVAEDGYYLRLEGRDAVYVSNSPTLGDTVPNGIEYYINPKLTTEPSNYNYYYTPNLSYYNNKVFTAQSDSLADRVVITYRTEEQGVLSEVTQGSFYPKESTDIKQLQDALANKKVGDGNFTFTITSNTLVAPGETVTYRLLSVVSYLSGDHEIKTAGAAIPADARVKITYTYTYNGRTSDTTYAVVDLADATLPAALRTAITSLTVGATTDTTVPVTYSGTGTTTVYRVEEISAIKDKDGKDMATVTEESHVTFRYAVSSDNGVTYGSAQTVTVPLQDAGVLSAIVTNLVGKTTKSAAFVFTTAVLNRYDLPYITYHVDKIDYTVMEQLELSFGFINPSERDIFYAGSTYTILGPDDRKFYALDANACFAVLDIFESLAGLETVKVGIDEAAMLEYGLYAHTLFIDMPYGLSYVKDSAGNTTEDIKYSFTIPNYLYISEAKDGYRYVGSYLYDIIVKVEASIFSFLDSTFYDWAQNYLYLVYKTDVRENEYDVTYRDFTAHYSFRLMTLECQYTKLNGSTSTRDFTVVFMDCNGLPLTATQQAVLNGYYAGLQRRLAAANTDISDTEAEITRYQQQNAQIRQLLTMITNVTERNQYLALIEENDAQIEKLLKTLVFQKNRKTLLQLEYDYWNEGYYNLDAWYLCLTGEETNEREDGPGVIAYTELYMNLLTITYWGEIATDAPDIDPSTLLADESNCVLTFTMTLKDGRTYIYRFYPYSERHALVSLQLQGEDSVSAEFFITTPEVKKIVTDLQNIVKGEDFDYETDY